MTNPFTWPMLATFATALAASSVLTPLAARWSRAVGLVDVPRSGEVQRLPIPRAGGHGIYLAFCVAVVLSLLVAPRVPEEMHRTIGLLAGVAVLVPCAMWDDFKRLGALPQLLAQLLIAAVPVAFGITISSISNPFAPPPFGAQILLPSWIAVPATIAWLVLMMNSMNWLDTMDGLAGGVGAIASIILVLVSLGLQQSTIALLPLALAGACLGFIPYNFNPARVFMGTTGSMFLGYALGVVSIIGGAKIASTMLVLGVPVLDSLLVIVQRSAAGRHPWRGGDNAHLVHRLLGMGLTQRKIALLVYALCALFGWLATSLIRTEKFYAFAALAIVIGGLIIYARLRAGARLRPRPTPGTPESCSPAA
ncbi:MAG: undecaprenyl/decaprenyl-phosphate alpha-N-acetylglucosaminyl 1-phosphate transferase [Chloroflexi bacterium]|nr:undecaprenyl/decaprenyl-phosphate alpha-N-acetylglucosaminyl 1-phosphate transferase [Chloroflexota bacterium]